MRDDGEEIYVLLSQVNLLAYRTAKDMGITDDVLRFYGIPVPMTEGLPSPRDSSVAAGPVAESEEVITVDRDGNKSVTVSAPCAVILSSAPCKTITGPCSGTHELHSLDHAVPLLVLRHWQMSLLLPSDDFPIS